MNQGVLFRYVPDSESEEAHFLVPSHERTLILKSHHDAPMDIHYGAEGTYTRIANNYYWTGMRKYITDYVENCPETALNTKLQIRNLPGYYRHLCQPNVMKPWPLISSGPEKKDGKRWILIIGDCTTNWIERFALPNATAKECAITFIEEVLLRYGITCRLIM
ncbi:transposon Tf2-8 polyprotein [Trichonephila clavipes]|nr:transposon Tf2-8 polyprotein [Trichonephila clavipes]